MNQDTSHPDDDTAAPATEAVPSVPEQNHEAVASTPVDAGPPNAGDVVVEGPAEHADAVVPSEAVDEAEEDDGPVELADPFEGDEDAKPIEEMIDESDAPSMANMEWFILKVQSNREDSISETLRRRIMLQGMEKSFGEVIVPKEQVTDFKGGKKRVVSRKLYPGYILVQMVLNDETWFLVRETGGIGDFTGSAGRPSPMLPQDVAKLLHKKEVETTDAPKLKINFKKGDRVKINEGTFENFEGEVEQIDEANGRVTVMLSIFGRSTPVDIEYWQIETV